MWVPKYLPIFTLIKRSFPTLKSITSKIKVTLYINTDVSLTGTLGLELCHVRLEV